MYIDEEADPDTAEKLMLDRCRLLPTTKLIGLYAAAVTYEQALASLKFKKPVDAGVGWTFAVIIEGG